MLARCAGGDKDLPADQRAVRDAGRLGLREGKPDTEAVRDRQAGRLHAGKLRQVPDRPEASRQAHGHPHARRRSVRRQRHADVLHQRQEADGAPTIEEFDKILEPLLARAEPAGASTEGSIACCYPPAALAAALALRPMHQRSRAPASAEQFRRRQRLGLFTDGRYHRQAGRERAQSARRPDRPAAGGREVIENPTRRRRHGDRARCRRCRSDAPTRR